MISVIIFQLTVILLFLSIRALMPELFIHNVKKQPACLPIKVYTRAKISRRSSHFVQTRNIADTGADSSRSAGIGMMIR